MAHSESTKGDICSNCGFEAALQKTTHTPILSGDMVMN